jgi:UDP-N-acetylmuramoylalanine--D-glutamate ligase
MSAWGHSRPGRTGGKPGYVRCSAESAEHSCFAASYCGLLPACASFDQYRNFEIRGARFRDLVTALPGVKPVV